MGRGRAKAKQTKVARQLKYSSPATDFEALENELGTGGDSVGSQWDDEDRDSRRSEYSYDER